MGEADRGYQQIEFVHIQISASSTGPNLSRLDHLDPK